MTSISQHLATSLPIDKPSFLPIGLCREAVVTMALMDAILKGLTDNQHGALQDLCAMAKYILLCLRIYGRVPGIPVQSGCMQGSS